MNTKEKNFSNVLKKYLLEQGVLVDKIESRVTTAGVPDLLLSMKSHCDCHAELKIIEAEGPKAGKLHLTPGQISWHAKRVLHGKCYPFICCVEKYNTMLIISSRKALEIVKAGGKVDLESIPASCFFTRNREGYIALIDTAICNFYSSQRVYK
jgi:hypothetical protein